MMSVTSGQYSYTEFDKKWPNIKAYAVSCGIGIMFKPLTCAQENQRYRCSIRINDSIRTANMKTKVFFQGMYFFKVQKFS